MPKIRQYFIILILSIPFLVSFKSLDNNLNEYASYLSEEGIKFVSYSKEWDRNKLIDLDAELKKNKYGKEIRLLKEIRVVGNKLSGSLTKGSYHALTKTIVLYQGDKYTKAEDYSKTLSHEYGHHFAYHYFPTHHFPYSEWMKIRGLQVTELRWDAFWNYVESNHAYYPQEIFAEDYVLLYGAVNEVNYNDVHSNEAFYLRKDHENSALPNPLDNKQLHKLLEEKSGLKIDDKRLISTPELTDLNNLTLLYKITAKANVAYRLTVELHKRKDNMNGVEYELYEVTSDNMSDEIMFSLENLQEDQIDEYKYITVTVDVVDLSTSIGFQTAEVTYSL